MNVSLKYLEKKFIYYFIYWIWQIVCIVGLVSAISASPQWYNPGPQPGYGVHPGGYSGHSAGAPLGADGRVVETAEVTYLKINLTI